MERLKHIKESLLSCVEAQMGDLAKVDAKELGEAIDMIKDMEEAMYYCSIVKAMEEHEEDEELEEKMRTHMHKHSMYYPYIHDPISMERDIDKEHGRMYYPRGGMKGRMNYPHYHGEDGEYRGMREDGFEESYPMEIRDSREGKSPISRKNYMESKELHHDSAKKMKELEKYLHELSQDITEMIQDSSPEEKSMLQQKLSTLATKIKNV